jgi:hypothetical protein
MNLYHSRDGLYFCSNSDASVSIILPSGIEVHLAESEWASVVAAVSGGGETAERWQAVREFHG